MINQGNPFYGSEKRGTEFPINTRQAQLLSTKGSIIRMFLPVCKIPGSQAQPAWTSDTGRKSQKKRQKRFLNQSRGGGHEENGLCKYNY